MKGKKEIRCKINSVINTQKITKAMEMVAASKMKKTEKRMLSGRCYFNTIQSVINNVIQGSLEYKHIYLSSRKVKRIGIILVSTDRGLCGGLNANLFKEVLLKLNFYKKKNVSCEFILLGTKAISFFHELNYCVLSKKNNIGDNPSISVLLKITKIMFQKYKDYNLDKIFLAYNKFDNKLLQRPVVSQLLPFFHVDSPSFKKKTWDYLYEPESKLILDTLFERYIKSQVYQSLLENIASEQAARMVAMKNATDNSGDIIEELQLIYNKVRQSNITQELTEIIAGASAISVD